MGLRLRGGGAEEGSALLDGCDAELVAAHFDAAGAGVALGEWLGGCPSLVYPLKGTKDGIPPLLLWCTSASSSSCALPHSSLSLMSAVVVSEGGFRRQSPLSYLPPLCVAEKKPGRWRCWRRGCGRMG